MTWSLVLQIVILAIVGVFVFAFLWGATRQSKNKVVLSADEHAALIEAKRTLAQAGQERHSVTLNELHKRIGDA